MTNQLFSLHRIVEIIGILLIGSILFFLTSCESGPPKNSKVAQAALGKVIFQNQCMPCHGLGEIKPTVDTLTKLAPDLSLIMKRRNTGQFPIAEIATFIDGRSLVKAHGTRQMPVWGEVYANEGMDEKGIRGRKGELVAFLMSIQK